MRPTYENEQVQPLFYIRREIQKELKNWLRGYKFRYFFTLTFSSDVSVLRAEKALDHFAQRLSKKAFGSAWKTGSDPTKRISFIATRERQASSRIHWHVAMQPLNGSFRLPTDSAVEAAIDECWSRCWGSGREFDSQLINRNKYRVLKYLIKGVRYDTDTFFVNWFSCH